MDLVQTLAKQYMKAELPEFGIGDSVRVNIKVKEGSRERIQAFDGVVIARKHGGISESITVRRVSYNVGCEKVFPLHSPNIVDIQVLRRAKVRRAKLYYLRGLSGKAAKLKEKL
ncbi:MAG: 50S ribosomal protein L19 [Oscillospiraceae bacterium]|jgi:large subunit ribosomal protein L19|nr:50S ribosomal protein L19 [Oscillospiraceae bacterium]